MQKNEIIKLLKEYKIAQAKLDLKKIDLKKEKLKLRKIRKRKYDVKIVPSYSETGGKTNLIKSKVETQVIVNEEEIRECNSKIEELKIEIEEAELDLKAINIRLGSLTYLEKEIMVAYYIDEMKYEDIGNEVFYRIRHQTRGPKAIREWLEKSMKKLEKLE